MKPRPLSLSGTAPLRRLRTISCSGCHRFVTSQHCDDPPRSCPHCGHEFTLAERTRLGDDTAAAEIRAAVERTAGDHFDLDAKECAFCRERYPAADWRCPQCGSIFWNHVWKEKPMAGTITRRGRKAKSVDPTIEPKTAEVKTFALENGKSAWECLDCGHKNDGRQPSCLACGNYIRQDLHAADQMLCFALEQDDEAQAAFAKLREEGATDGLILSQVTTVLEMQATTGGLHYAGMKICWDIDDDRRVRLWYGEDEPPARGKPDLEGQALVLAVRNLYGISTTRNLLSAAQEEPEEKAAPPARKKRQASPKTAAAEERGYRLGHETGDGRVHSIELEKIDPNPHQPRKRFDEGELKKLAASIKKHGLLQPIGVRPKADGRYELLFGERRLRALKLAKLVYAPALVADVQDTVSLEMVGEENESRQDLDPLERIRWWKQLLDAKVHKSQKELANKLGMSRPALSNLLRLLELPESVQALVSQETLPTTHARSLVPWADCPAVMADVATLIERDGARSVDAFQADVADIVEFHSRATDRIGPDYLYDRVNHRNRTIECALTPDVIKRNAQELDIRQVKDHYGDTEPRAFNVELWERLNDEATEAQAAKATSSKNGEPTAAEKREATRKRNEQVNKRRYRWLLAELQNRIVDRLSTGGVDEADLIRMLLYFTTRPGSQFSITLEALAKKAAPKKRTGQTIWDGLAAIRDKAVGDYGDQKLWTAVVEALAEWVAGKFEGYHPQIEPAAIEGMAKSLGIDVTKDFRPTEEFLKLFTKDELLDLHNKEWKLGKLAGENRGGIVRLILKATEGKTVPCPKAVQAIKPVNLW